MSRSDVLIIGAGPTGLVLALWLAKQGIKVRILDKEDGPGTTSRALTIQARTLELYRQLDLTDEILEKGHEVPGANLWVQGRKKARIPFDDIARDLTPYGPLIYPQDQHERLLIERLAALGVSVEHRTTLLGFSEAGDHIVATLSHANGPAQTCETRYIAGCDGARSTVREGMGTGFPGGTYQQVFYVADIIATGAALDGELHINLDEADFLAVFPLKGAHHARLIGTVRDERAAHPENLTFEDISTHAIEHMKVQIQTVNWFSTYRVHHRVTARFRSGRAFLLGDAAHIHSPAGGQGMNTGIGDAINLAWKLKAVLTGQASDALLDTYDTERRAFATKLVATTDRGFMLATAEGWMADFIRTRIIPLVAPALFRFEAARNYMFGAVSQIAINYRNSALSEGAAGGIKGGDRLPWMPPPGTDNFESLNMIGWQVHVYGEASAELADWCRHYGLPLHTYAWQDIHPKKWPSRNAIFLLRPDTYIALAAPQQNVETLRRYFAEHGLVRERIATV